MSKFGVLFSRFYINVGSKKCELRTANSVTALSVHISYFYSAIWLDDILPRVGFLIAHVSCSGYFMCHALVPPRVAFLFDHVAYSGSTVWSTINLS